MKKSVKSSWLDWNAIRWGLIGIGVAGLLWRAALPSQVLRVESLLKQHDFALIGPERHAFANYLVTIAEANHLDPLMVLAVMKVESEFKMGAVSGRGAMGLLQLKPIAAKAVEESLNFTISSKHELLDPFKNLAIGVQYLVHLRGIFGYDWNRMLVAYNMGPTAAKQFHIRASSYSRKVMKAYQDFGEI